MKKETLHFIDFLKISVLIAICSLHNNEFMFFTDNFMMEGKASSDLVYYFTRWFSLGGQILVFLIYFLFAYAEKSKKALGQIALFAMFGQIVLTLIFLEGRTFFEAFTWDIYVYLAFCNLVLIALPRKIKSSWITILISLGFLCFPNGFFQNLVGNDQLSIVLTGKLQGNNIAAWPLLPWFFLCPFATGLGYKAREYRATLSHWHKVEFLIWPVLGLLCIPVFGHYYHVPLGPHFYQYVFNQDAWTFWGNFWVYIFWVRLAFLDSIQNYLASKPWAHFISRLYWCRHLGLVYLISLVYLGIAMNYSEFFERTPALFNVYFLGTFIFSELLARLIIKVFRMLK